jgi:hypothetical protein
MHIYLYTHKHTKIAPLFLLTIMFLCHDLSKYFLKPEKRENNSGFIALRHTYIHAGTTLGHLPSRALLKEMSY